MKGPVAAIVVTYLPDDKFLSFMSRIAGQVDYVIVSDNGGAASLLGALGENLKTRLLSFGKNIGVSAAQNQGIALARELGVEYVLLFDQDSLPAPDMVDNLFKSYSTALAAGYRIAAVGPRFFDERFGEPHAFIRIRGLFLERIHEPDFGDLACVDYLISSGSLIPLASLDEIGGMCDELFIDYIDVEWGLRAKAKGFQSFGSFGARMKHNLGDKPLIFMGRAYPAHTPFRHYHIVRNAIWLYRQKGLPWRWKLLDARRLCMRVVFYALFLAPRVKQSIAMLKGVLHGLGSREKRKYEL